MKRPRPRPAAPVMSVPEALTILDPLADAVSLDALLKLADQAREHRAIGASRSPFASSLKRRRQELAASLDAALGELVAAHADRRRTLAALAAVGEHLAEAEERDCELTNMVSTKAAELGGSAASGLRGMVEALNGSCGVLASLVTQLDAKAKARADGTAAVAPARLMTTDPAALEAALAVLDPIAARMPRGTDWEDLAESVRGVRMWGIEAMRDRAGWPDALDVREVRALGMERTPPKSRAKIRRVLALAAPRDRERVHAALEVVAKHLGELEEIDNALGVELSGAVVQAVGGGVRSGALPLRATVARGDRACAALQEELAAVQARQAGLERGGAGTVILLGDDGRIGGLAHLERVDLERLAAAVAAEMQARGLTAGTSAAAPAAAPARRRSRSA